MRKKNWTYQKQSNKNNKTHTIEKKEQKKTKTEALMSTQENEIKHEPRHKLPCKRKYRTISNKNQENKTAAIATHKIGIPITNVRPENQYAINPMKGHFAKI